MELVRGAGYLREGVRFLRARPRLFLLGMVPALLVFVLLAAAIAMLALNLADLIGWVTPFADDWGDGPRRLTRFLLGVVVLVGALVLATSVFTGITLFVGEPFYRRIWLATEHELGGEPGPDAADAGQSLRESLTLMASGAVTSALVVASGAVPVVGPIIGAAAGVVVSGRVLARELVARPLEARGLDRDAQERLLTRRRGRLFGFGVATQMCFLVPLGAVVMMPVAVVAATMLARDVLARDVLASDVLASDVLASDVVDSEGR